MTTPNLIGKIDSLLEAEVLVESALTGTTVAYHCGSMSLKGGRVESIDYMMSHRPSKTSPVHDLTLGGVIPDNIYTHPQYYANLSDKAYKESWAAIVRVRGKPSATVTIYRASPRSMLNKGDWVSLSKSYAKQEAAVEESPVQSFKVKASDVWFAGNDINEFGYWGKKIKEDKAALHASLEKEKKAILKRGKIPANAILNPQYRKSSYSGMFGTTPREHASAYYEFISDVIDGTALLPKD